MTTRPAIGSMAWISANTEREPATKILAALGLEKVTTYRKARPAPMRDAEPWSTRTPERLQAWVWDRCIPEPNSACWIWLGPICARSGYGVINNSNAPTTRPHRLSFIAHKGPIPAGQDVHHRCKNKACCKVEIAQGER